MRIPVSKIQVIIQAAYLRGVKENLRHLAFYQACANWGICMVGSVSRVRE
jgi:hypothetical protein